MKTLLFAALLLLTPLSYAGAVRDGQTIFAGCAIAGGVDDKATLEKGEFVCKKGRPADPAPFAGNGRSCGTCHVPGDNFGLSAKRIATLDPRNPLFFELDEDQFLLRKHALIHVIAPGEIDELRATPKLVHLRENCSAAGKCDALGLLADRTTNLDEFNAQAVANHLSLTTRRQAGLDFRTPNTRELRALRAYLRSRLVSDQDERSRKTPAASKPKTLQAP